MNFVSSLNMGAAVFGFGIGISMVFTDANNYFSGFLFFTSGLNVMSALYEREAKV
jgi:hypothetical protein